jgi:hypothetical protein
MSKTTLTTLALLLAFSALFAPSIVLAETAKARVLAVDEKKSQVKVDVAGQQRTYYIVDRDLYKVLIRGRLVVITAELVANRHTIVKAEPAAQEGQVESVDAVRWMVTIKDKESNASMTYVIDKGVDRNLREGDMVNFDVEERGTVSVITRWRRMQ